MTKSSGILALALLLMAAVPARAQKNKISDGRDLLRAMRERYDGKWFRTAVFLQDNTLYGPDGKVSGHSQWDHHMQFPGKLRIDFVPVSDGNGVLLANDSQYVFQGGKMVGKRPRTLSLLVVAFDVYAQPPEKSIAQMEQLKFDLSQLRSDRW